MTTDRLPTNPDFRQTDDNLGYVPYHTSMQQITLSNIAERLRIVHNQMKRRAPLYSSQKMAEAPEKAINPLKGYLDDIARALLAEYNTRRTSEQNLLNRISELENIIKESVKKRDDMLLSRCEGIAQQAANEMRSQIKLEIEGQAKTVISANQAANQEILRQVKESASMSRFSVQLASLEQQVLKIQSALEARKQIVNEHKITAEEPSLSNNLSTDDEKGIKEHFHKPILRQLAEEKMHLCSMNAENSNNLNALEGALGQEQHLNSQTCSETTTNIRPASQIENSHAKDLSKNESSTAKKVTKLMILALMATVSYGLYLQYNNSAGDSLFSLFN